MSLSNQVSLIKRANITLCINLYIEISSRTLSLVCHISREKRATLGHLKRATPSLTPSYSCKACLTPFPGYFSKFMHPSLTTFSKALLPIAPSSLTSLALETTWFEDRNLHIWVFLYCPPFPVYFQSLSTPPLPPL